MHVNSQPPCQGIVQASTNGMQRSIAQNAKVQMSVTSELLRPLQTCLCSSQQNWDHLLTSLPARDRALPGPDTSTGLSASRLPLTSPSSPKFDRPSDDGGGSFVVSRNRSRPCRHPREACPWAEVSVHDQAVSLLNRGSGAGPNNCWIQSSSQTAEFTIEALFCKQLPEDSSLLHRFR